MILLYKIYKYLNYYVNSVNLLPGVHVSWTEQIYKIRERLVCNQRNEYNIVYAKHYRFDLYNNINVSQNFTKCFSVGEITKTEGGI